MNDKELKAINQHLSDTDSGWFKIIERFTDGTILIRHGTHNRAYNKLLSIKE